MGLRSGGEQIDDLLNGVVGVVVGGFELAGRLVMGVGAVVEAAIGERAAQPFVEEETAVCGRRERAAQPEPLWG